MIEFERLLGVMLGPRADGVTLPLLDPEPLLDPPDRTPQAAIRALNAAFLVALCGAAHPARPRAAALLENPPPAAPHGLAGFYRDALGMIGHEVREAVSSDPDAESRLALALSRAADGLDPQRAAEALWALFFPEGVGILGHEQERIDDLRRRRTVRLSALSASPIVDPAAEVLFASNVLLTVPAPATDVERLPYPQDMRHELRAALDDRQLRWYDHPIQIGVEPDRNELLYGLRGLDEAAAYERRHGRLSTRLRVVLSVSVTHDRLQRLAHAYVREELARAGGFDNLDVHVFTEAECRRLVEDVLAPGMAGEATALGDVFGVDGEYGRHYSFLKAIAALWNVLVDPAIRATFKIDLDQVFPHERLVAETGHSAFEHLMTPLWGAMGVDSWGREVELGMIAGALVNERDIGKGLFTPDVDLPEGPTAPDEYVFFSRLPQALSTRAEMMERYDTPARDGRDACLERVHVTGGTNGILVDSLRRHRPFTPSFFGRAEDQAYILSVLGGAQDRGMPRLSYAHAAGLIMRHDKEAFAGEAIEAARVGKLVGDDVRILYFSAYAELLGREGVKALADPFTGCFISRLPQTVVLLRFVLRMAHAFERGDARLALELAEMGAPRIAAALGFVGDQARLARRVEGERDGWNRYYDALDHLELELSTDEPHAVRARQAARRIIGDARVSAAAEASG